MKKALVLLTALLLVLFAACNRRAQNEAAVRRALDQYLASRPTVNMQSMEMEVRSIQLREDTAEAEVTFRAKSDPKATMSTHYTLKRSGGRWEVQPQVPGSGHSVMPRVPGGAGDLPSGHPPAGSSQPSELPQGHPPVKSK